ncbi:glycosyl hydrolase [Arenibacter latericius]|uniref:glycosyl hydrolase n=1 Tax=Arenibacter latericius TaxID=86104 RepID=UPI001F0A81C9|nr:glycosyl hydrolase [Arenibacter latericius]
MSTNMKLSPLLFLIVLSLLFSQCSKPEEISQSYFESLVDDFKSPPGENHLWCYWYWIGDDISKEGITRDLKAMKAVGIGTALIGNINPEEKDGPVPILSEEWWSHMVHAVNEGKRLGVDIGAFNSPGWSMSGGPWITSDKTMRHLVYSETLISGGEKLAIKLDQPKAEFQDVYVLAFPKDENEVNYLDASNSKITVTPAIENASNLLNGNTTVSNDFTAEEHTIVIPLDL